MTPGSDAGPSSAGERPAARPSGLRNPARAARGAAAGTLILETVVLLLAIQPMRQLGGGLRGSAIAVIVTLAVLAVLIAGQLRRRWAWVAGGMLQVALLAAGYLNPALAVLGVAFGGAWLYALHVRRTVLRPPAAPRDAPPAAPPDPPRG